MSRLLIALAIWVVLVPACGAHAVAKGSLPVPTYDRGTQDKPVVVQQKGPLTIQVRVAEQVSPEDRARQERSEKDKSVEDHRLSVSTIVLAALTLVLAVVAIGQLIMFYFQLKVTRDALEDAKEAADASRLAAEAAKESADSQQKTERAYLFVTVADLHVGADNDGLIELQASVVVHNYGKTPAVPRVWRGVLIDLHDAPDEIPDHPTAKKEMPEGLVIGSNAYERFGLQSTGYRKVDYDNMKGANVGLFAFGEIIYDDVMGVQHKTGFCWQCQFIENGESWTIVPSKINRTT